MRALWLEEHQSGKVVLYVSRTPLRCMRSSNRSPLKKQRIITKTVSNKPRRLLQDCFHPHFAAESEVVVGIYIALLICIAKVAHARKRRDSAELGKVPRDEKQVLGGGA